MHTAVSLFEFFCYNTLIIWLKTYTMAQKGWPSGPPSSNCLTPSAPLNQLTRSFVNCSNLGLSFDSCRSKSSTVPILVINSPGKPEETRYIRVPQSEQKWFSIVFPLAIVLFCANLVSLSFPRVWVVRDSLTMKFDANMEAVILRQSAQLQTKESTYPSPSVG